MIQFQNLQKYKNIIHGVLERKDDSVHLVRFAPQLSNGLNIFSHLANNVLRALKKLSYRAKIDNLIFAEQIHSYNVYFCPSGISGYIKFQTDGLISKTPGQILIVKTADCLPILIYSSRQKMVGAIHAGREGIIKGIIERAIKFFDSSDLIVAIGPHIRNCCYYLRGKAEKYSQIPQLRKYIQKRGRKLYFDLTQIVIDKLLRLGVKKENIEDCNICTFCQSKRFYSARKMAIQKELSSFPCFGSFIGLK